MKVTETERVTMRNALSEDLGFRVATNHVENWIRDLKSGNTACASCTQMLERIRANVPAKP